jgi:HlyD family secretion protein
VFAGKNELIGRPVAVGERLLEIADPAHVEFRIDVPVADAIILREGARVKVFLDSNPLRSTEATVVRSDYLARVNDGVQLSFRVVARLDGNTGPIPRLGARGTAQIYGDKVALLFYLLRRPYSTIRQWTGL